MKNYWIYFTASLISLIGSNYFIFTQGWYLLELTGQKTSVGVTWSLFFLPSLLFLPVVGKLFDGFDLKRVLIAFETAKGILFLTFVPLLWAYPSKGVVYTLAVLYGIAFVPYYPSAYVMVKRLVPSDRQTQYSHFFEVSLQVANIVAVFSSGLVYSTIGFLGLLLFSAVLILVGLIGMKRLELPGPATPSKPGELIKGWTEIGAAVRRIVARGELTPRQIAFGVCHQFPQSVILVGNVAVILYVFEIMNRGPKEFGWIDSLFGVAALGASLLWSRWHEASERPEINTRVTLAAGVVIMAMSVIPSEGAWPYVWMLLYGALLVSSKLLSRAAVVRMVPRDQMGVFSALFQTCGYVVMMGLFAVISWLSASLRPDLLFVVLGFGVFAYGAGLTLARPGVPTAS